MTATAITKPQIDSALVSRTLTDMAIAHPTSLAARIRPECFDAVVALVARMADPSCADPDIAIMASLARVRHGYSDYFIKTRPKKLFGFRAQQWK